AISWLPVSWLHLTLMGRYVGAQYFQNPDTSRWGRLGSSRMLDARLEVLPLESLRLWVRGTNLTDANVQGHYSYPEPGRQVFTGLSLEWPEKKSDQGWTM
ncbi:MAG TPA: TonB-dependent receptor, partial [Polyangiaceae bacterium]|nr:TonB-dependent receptor [Polyangiaceae bacterium]